jgi:Zn finger protein HypA/HybF involved in hydrogenase expression
MTPPKQPKDWQCQECDRTMTLKQAEKAVSQGCPRCGGTDIDLFERVKLTEEMRAEWAEEAA